jgi:hypothetical protein
VIYRLAMAFIISIALAGVAWGAATTEDIEYKYIYNMDQKVEGNGFFNSYKNITAGNLELGSKGHGSGSYNYEAKLHAEMEFKYDSTSQDYYGSSERKIAFDESVDYAYGLSRLQLGKSFRSGAFSSLGKEVTCVKNYGGNVSMNAHFDSLDTLSKDISANLYWKAVTSDDYPYGDSYGISDEVSGRTALNVDAAFTGRGHIGVLAVNENLHDVRKMVDEDYIGTFSIVKKMSHEFNYKMKAEPEDWLPCCFDGWSSMNYRDQKGFGKSTRGVFDCTCFAPPKSITV